MKPEEYLGAVEGWWWQKANSKVASKNSGLAAGIWGKPNATATFFGIFWAPPPTTTALSHTHNEINHHPLSTQIACYSFTGHLHLRGSYFNYLKQVRITQWFQKLLLVRAAAKGLTRCSGHSSHMGNTKLKTERNWKRHIPQCSQQHYLQQLGHGRNLDVHQQING